MRILTLAGIFMLRAKREETTRINRAWRRVATQRRAFTGDAPQGAVSACISAGEPLLALFISIDFHIKFRGRSDATDFSNFCPDHLRSCIFLRTFHCWLRGLAASSIARLLCCSGVVVSFNSITRIESRQSCFLIILNVISGGSARRMCAPLSTRRNLIPDARCRVSQSKGLGRDTDLR
jgi:hypothetical protein